MIIGLWIVLGLSLLLVIGSLCWVVCLDGLVSELEYENKENITRHQQVVNALQNHNKAINELQQSTPPPISPISDLIATPKRRARKPVKTPIIQDIE